MSKGPGSGLAPPEILSVIPSFRDKSGTSIPLTFHDAIKGETRALFKKYPEPNDLNLIAGMRLFQPKLESQTGNNRAVLQEF